MIHLSVILLGVALLGAIILGFRLDTRIEKFERDIFSNAQSLDKMIKTFESWRDFTLALNVRVADLESKKCKCSSGVPVNNHLPKRYRGQLEELCYPIMGKPEEGLIPNRECLNTDPDYCRGCIHFNNCPGRSVVSCSEKATV